MLPILTKEEMKSLDRDSFSKNLGQGFKYMEEAVNGILSLDIWDKNKRVIIFTGKGNNGGDGLLLAYKLIKKGLDVQVFSLASEEEFQNEARIALEKFLGISKNFFYLKFHEDINLIREKIPTNKNPMILVDALLGIGSNGEPRDFYPALIEFINTIKIETASLLVSIDIPSGIELNSAKNYNNHIKADRCISLGLPKISEFFYPSKSSYGKKSFFSLNYPHEIIKKNHLTKIFIPETEDIKEWLPERKITGNKFDHGQAFLFAGSSGMSGAALLASKAALRSGLGMLFLVSSEDVLKIVGSNVWEAVLSNSLDIVHQRDFQVACIGPGISTSPQISEQLEDFMQDIEIPVILDADGINIFRGKPEKLSSLKKDVLVTPHDKEFERLFSLNLMDFEAPLERIKIVQSKALEFNLNILLKGSPSIISDARGKAIVLPYGNTALASAGSGDVLSGIITGIAAQNFISEPSRNKEISTLIKSAVVGAWIHGRCAELASERLTEYSTLASDLIDEIPNALRAIF